MISLAKLMRTGPGTRVIGDLHGYCVPHREIERTKETACCGYMDYPTNNGCRFMVFLTAACVPRLVRTRLIDIRDFCKGNYMYEQNVILRVCRSAISCNNRHFLNKILEYIPSYRESHSQNNVT